MSKRNFTLILTVGLTLLALCVAPAMSYASPGDLPPTIGQPVSTTPTLPPTIGQPVSMTPAPSRPEPDERQRPRLAAQPASLEQRLQESGLLNFNYPADLFTR